MATANWKDQVIAQSDQVEAQRWTKRWGVSRLRAMRSSSARCSGQRTIKGAGRAMAGDSSGRGWIVACYYPVNFRSVVLVRSRPHATVYTARLMISRIRNSKNA